MIPIEVKAPAFGFREVTFDDLVWMEFAREHPFTVSECRGKQRDALLRILSRDGSRNRTCTHDGANG
jgi:hypothetical protein